MSRKKKAPPSKPSKAYLVSFGDTMTALLAFFIVLNSFAEDQTGANMYTGTGSFVNAVSSIGLPGGNPGDRSYQTIPKENPSPIYAVSDRKQNRDHKLQLGPDTDADNKRIIDQQTNNFKRFLAEMNRTFDVQEHPPTRSQVVFDSFEKLNKTPPNKPAMLLQESAMEIASETVNKLIDEKYKLEIIVWAQMPGQNSMKRAMEKAILIEQQVENSFRLTASQRSRFSTSAKPWLFVDAKRPKISFVLSALETEVQ